jgi:hypothetical protein
MSALAQEPNDTGIASEENARTISPQRSTIPACVTPPIPTNCAALKERMDQLVESVKATREFVDATFHNLSAEAEADLV